MLIDAPAGAEAVTEHQSLSVWLLMATVSCLAVLSAAVLGPSYTGLSGDWIAGNTLYSGQLFLAQVGLTEVKLQSGSGWRTISLKEACAEAGGVDTDASKWCALDQLGSDTESVLTAAFVPALVVLVLSSLTALQNCCFGEPARPVAVRRPPPSSAGSDAAAEPPPPPASPGLQSTLYNAIMLIAWLLFWLMTASGLCTYALRSPATLGVGRSAPSKSYHLMRACVLFTSLGAIALLARALSLWDTATVQLMLKDMRESRFLKFWLYAMLCMQLALYAPISLLHVDYAPVICFIGLNYLATRAPQMLWGYALLTLATLPQDAAEVARMAQWQAQDAVDHAARIASVLVVLLKLAIMLGMLLMHTRIRFKLQFFEFEQIHDEPAALDGSPGGVAYQPSSSSPDSRYAGGGGKSPAASSPGYTSSVEDGVSSQYGTPPQPRGGGMIEL